MGKLVSWGKQLISTRFDSVTAVTPVLLLDSMLIVCAVQSMQH